MLGLISEKDAINRAPDRLLKIAVMVFSVQIRHVEFLMTY